MNNDLLSVLKLVSEGTLNAEQALETIQGFTNGSDAKIDTDRKNRVGFEEVVYGRGKTPAQIAAISKVYAEKQVNFICTGLSEEKINGLRDLCTDCTFVPEAGIVKRIVNPIDTKEGTVAVITAGTSDLYVAKEAKEILEFCGVGAKLYADIGVAGIHRFLSHKDDISRADVIIVIAGMEGALPSITGGMFPQPVIAVPTSAGYGTALNGFTALFAMLTSCAAGLTVVNIDNGFGAAMAAVRIINILNLRKSGH
ncbi:nickel pincer cofactor biosynthesis protein LarB [Seleniivibrio woodruffii]|uniref:nickel pincer cofactor biosynthesis protein LarB n=1 Tax=Seleniivibrio woodruffii TaxID=1078050 RepID=UPI0026F0F00F|nr:nickel pincer cofactor biosynthesis protein LarB [Seleniivibrio woodruffii]